MHALNAGPADLLALDDELGALEQATRPSALAATRAAIFIRVFTSELLLSTLYRSGRRQRHTPI